VIPFVCDDPDRIGARIFRALRSDCPCCTFWRGYALGCIASGVAAGLLLAARAWF